MKRHIVILAMFLLAMFLIAMFAAGTIFAVLPTHSAPHCTNRKERGFHATQRPTVNITVLTNTLPTNTNTNTITTLYTTITT